MEQLLDLPEVIRSARETLRTAREIVQFYGRGDSEGDLRKVEAEIEAAIAERDATVIRRLDDEAMRIAVQAMPREHVTISAFEQRAAALDGDPRPEVRGLVRRGREMVATGRLDGLGGVVAQLGRYVPDESPAGPGLRPGAGSSTVQAEGRLRGGS